MPNVGTGTLAEFGIALDLRENYRWLGGEEDRVNRGGGVTLNFKDTFTGSVKTVKTVHLKSAHHQTMYISGGKKASNEVSHMKSKIVSERQQDDKTAQFICVWVSFYLNCSQRSGRGEEGKMMSYEWG